LSGVVALSMGPMVASRLLKENHKEHTGGPFAALGRVFAGFYRRTLRLALHNPMVVILVALVFAGSSYYVFGSLRQEITPSEDRSAISLRVTAPNTVSLDFVRTRLGQVESMLQPYVESGEVASIFVLSGWGSGGFLTLTLDRKSTRLNSSHVKISYAVFCF